MPKNIKDIFKLCRSTYYWGTHIRQAIKKIAEYPVTEVVIEEKMEALKKQWEEIFEKFKIFSLHKSIGCTFFTYGNYFASIVFPFERKFTCPMCKKEFFENQVTYKFTKFFVLVFPYYSGEF